MKVIGVLAAYWIILLIDFPSLRKMKSKKLTIVFFAIFGITLLLAILEVIGVKMINPMIVLDDWMKKIGLHY